MDIESLQEKVQKAELNVEKRKKTIERHHNQLAKKLSQGYIEDSFEVRMKREDIKGAEKKLAEAQRILLGHIDRLEKEQNKLDYITGNAPQIIQDFLDRWAKLTLEWHIKRYRNYYIKRDELKKQEIAERIKVIEANHDLYSIYLNINGKYIFKSYFELINVRPRKQIEEHLEELKLDYKSVNRRLANYAGGTVLRMVDMYNEEEAVKWVERKITQEKIDKMTELISRITKVTGLIEDASYLTIGHSGALNGVVHGEKGSAKVETIMAGGWNIQCFHFRTLVHEIK